MPTKKPKNIDTPFALRRHNIKPQTFLTRNKQYTDLRVASFVFYPAKSDLIQRSPYNFVTDKGIASNAALNTPIQPAQLLILQRTPTDPTSPNLWEVPWGVSKLTDRTILYSVQRVMFERTGLHIKRFLNEVGDGEEFITSEGVPVQFSFVVEVAEMTHSHMDGIPVKVDPNEHQEFLWVTKEDIIDENFPLIVDQHKDLILQAFQLRKETEDEVRARAVRASRARKEAYRLGYQVDFEGDDDDEDDDEEEDEAEEDDEEGEYIPKLRWGKRREKRVAKKS